MLNLKLHCSGNEELMCTTPIFYLKPNKTYGSLSSMGLSVLSSLAQFWIFNYMNYTQIHTWYNSHSLTALYFKVYIVKYRIKYNSTFNINATLLYDVN